jgi:hypothetical protein
MAIHQDIGEIMKEMVINNNFKNDLWNFFAQVIFFLF